MDWINSGIGYKKLLLGLGLAVIAVPAGIILAGFDPTEYNFYPKCLFYVATGMYCPGCGSTRAIHHLLNGRISQALGMNPLMFAAIPLIGGLLIFPKFARRPSVPLVVAIAVIFYGILRNLPEFSFLAP